MHAIFPKCCVSAISRDTYSHSQNLSTVFLFPSLVLSPIGSSFVILAQGHTASPSVSMASSCPSAVSRSFTVPPCGLSAQPTRLCLWCSFSCLIPLVLDDRGPCSLHCSHNLPLTAAVLPVYSYCPLMLEGTSITIPVPSQL